MEERGIIIADRDAKYRKEVADHFKKAGYRVETTDSAVHALCSILEKQTPVLLLGSDFDEKVSSADLIHLLKKCNRHLHVIMVSDEMPLALARRIRREGIFYHALKPSDASDTAELGMAVACAFEQKNQVSGQLPQQKAPQERPAAIGEGSEGAESARAHLNALPLAIGLGAMFLGLSYLSLLVAQGIKEGTAAIGIFIGFCALIIAAQLLPIFRIKLPVSWRKAGQAKQQGASQDKK